MVDVPVLFGDRFFPATKALGFIHSPAESVTAAYVAWMGRIGHRVESEFHQNSLEAVLPLLEPLSISPSRIIIAATGHPEWSAIFQNSIAGNDPSSSIAVLCKDLETEGVQVSLSPDVREEPGGKLGRLGARVFSYWQWDPATDSRVAGTKRSIYLARQSGSRWLFDLQGQPLPFEDTASYQRRRLTERFTPEMLIGYCKALGIDPFNEDFYPGPCHLVIKEIQSRPGAAPVVSTFAEQQQKWQIAPAQ